MAKSRETFNKKEKEQKKLKKRENKQERKEERKANVKNGNDLNQMLAYVDENGNISSAPPDPTRHKEVKLEDVQIGVRKHEPVSEEEKVRTGIVSTFNKQKGYGFIKDLQSQESIFVHINALTEEIHERDKVSFEVRDGFKGKNAVNVKKVTLS